MPTSLGSPAPNVGFSHGSDGLVASPSKDWLASMIFAVKKMASGTQFVAFPYMQTALGAVVILLETVERVIKNRDDLRDLCANIIEIVLVVRGEILAHGNTLGLRFVGLCEEFVGVVKTLQHGLERLQRSRQGLRGRLKEMVGATHIADEIGRYRTRVNDLRSNFMLLATLNTNLGVADVLGRLAAISHIQAFRQIAMGDVNLLYETAIENKVRRIKIFKAQIVGETSAMTVAKYENDQETVAE
ncbi:hypothetical protein B0H14DRAFT_3472579 [Mycena olivaceomarginata]|nr:hypothetical protein B0H14DRAFT_3472579 [Mycena olivaceomarginata]